MFLINKYRNGIKKFKNIFFKKNDFIEIEYDCVHISTTKPFYKRLELNPNEM